MSDTIKIVEALTKKPAVKEAFDRWIEQTDIAPFLRANLERDHLIAYLSCASAFINVVAVPADALERAETKELVNWNLGTGLSWSLDIVHSPGETTLRVGRSPSNLHGGLLESAEKLLFPRSFDGREGSKHYVEVLQKLSHMFDLHFVEARNAYCRIDRRGDIEEVIRIREIPEKGDRGSTTLVTIDRMTLHEYLTATDSFLLVLFDFTRYPRGFTGWSHLVADKTVSKDGIFFRQHVEHGYASYTRGAQIVRSQLSKADVIARLDYFSEKPRNYVPFIAFDWKNGIVKEISTAPDCLSNYFVKSDLPFELSPAFFRPEVLSKYKADTEKYTLEDRSITCRNSWHLETYDRNDAGQVHTYLIYLQRLPYEEQLYWKSFNEEPKAPISHRSFTTDFEGRWDTTYDALPSLKAIVSELDQRSVCWWTLRSRALLTKVQYPVTPSSDEWANELLNLDQLLVEGFEGKWLRQKASSLGRSPDPKFGSLKLAEECLCGIGMSESDAQGITASLRLLHSLRSTLKGHASGERAADIRRKAISEHGGYGTHFWNLCKQCDHSMRAITGTFRSLE